MGLAGDTNKAESAQEQGNFIPQDEYESSLSEQEILELVNQWKNTYATYFNGIDETQKLAFNYWIGKHHGDELDPGQTLNAPPQLIDNKIFEAVETFLPIATRANPDPLVQADPSDMGQGMAKAIKSALLWEADRQKLRRKLARTLRHWAIYRIGVIKVSWDVPLQEIRTDVINPRRIIFDKDGFIDEGGKFVGEYIGEKKKTTAARLAELFPKKKADITIKAQGKMGTKVEYMEWWYKGEDVFYTWDDTVLGKFKNPNWNYDIPGQDAQEEERDEQDTIVTPASSAVPPVKGKNHMKRREAPYTFLSVFSVGLHPHDETSLILQNITLQDLVNRRLRQIDKNVDGMNQGIIVSEDFTEEQAAHAASALRKGKAIRVPTKGNINEKVARFAPPPLPRDLFTNFNDAKQELASVFGTAGSTPQAMEEQDTIRGKIMVSQQDSSRIGGAITEQLEQVADSIYNWWAQMMFVYYDEEHFVIASGQQGGLELIVLKNQAFAMLHTLDITVKEGSLIPKDPLTQRNEAIDLWSANAIDPLTFYKRLDFPDPVTQTQQLMLWQLYQKGAIPPQAYLPSFQLPAQPAPIPGAQPGTGGPAVSPPPNQGVVNPQSAQPPEQAVAHQLIQNVPLPR